MKDEFSLRHLSSVQFEELCFDLIKELGFDNISWRKGTGLSSSPSDQGRDIEAIRKIKDVDGQISMEKWFFECKHYERGVPPEKLQGSIAWANAESPDKLVFIVSSFLSNPSKQWIENFIISNSPRFKIKIWEQKQIQDLVFDKLEIKNKYKLNHKIEFLDLLHPNHLRYCIRPSINSLDYLFELLDNLDPKLRNEVLGMVQLGIIKPRFRPPKHDNETLGELRIDPVNYEVFKTKCRKISESISESLVVRLVVNTCLSWAFLHGDKTRNGLMRKSNQELLEYLKTNDDIDSDMRLSLIKQTEERLLDLPSRTKKAYEGYVEICEKIISKLFQENLLMDSTLSDN